MTEPNFELSFLETSAREADAEGRTLVIDPGYVFEALEKLAEARARTVELERQLNYTRGVLSCIGPVSGYVVAIDEPVGMDLPEGFRHIIRDKGDARDAVNMLRYNDPEAGPTVTYRMFELREVQS